MNYYEKLGWKLGKENEIFLTKGPEKLFFETLEKLDPKYVEVFKDLLKYINKNSIVNFMPRLFPSGKNETNETFEDFAEMQGIYNGLDLMEIIEITPRDKEKLLDFDEAIVENGICLKSEFKTTYLIIKKLGAENYELEFISSTNEYIGYDKGYYNCFSVNDNRKEVVILNSNDIFKTAIYKYNSKKKPFSFSKNYPIICFVIIELLKKENYFFKDFSKEMKQILNKGMNIK